MKELKSVISGLALGAGLGFVAGVLLAPQSGKRTRKKLVKESLKMTNELKGNVDRSIQSLREQFNAKVDQLAGRSKEVINNTSEKVKM